MLILLLHCKVLLTLCLEVNTFVIFAVAKGDLALFEGELRALLQVLRLRRC